MTDLNNGAYSVEYMSEQAGPATMQVRGEELSLCKCLFLNVFAIYAWFYENECAQVYLYQRVNQSGSISDIQNSVCQNTAARASCSLAASFASASSNVFQLNFTVQDPSVTQSVASSDVRALEAVTAGDTNTFTITPYDLYRNPITAQGYSFDVSLTGSDGRRVVGSVEYQSASGVYQAAYTTTWAGNYTLFVRRGGRGIKGLIGSRYVQSGSAGFPGLIVSPGGTDGASCVINHPTVVLPDGNGFGGTFTTYGGIVGAPISFSITAYDLYGNQVRSIFYLDDKGGGANAYMAPFPNFHRSPHKPTHPPPLRLATSAATSAPWAVTSSKSAWARSTSL